MESRSNGEKKDARNSTETIGNKLKLVLKPGYIIIAEQALYSCYDASSNFKVFERSRLHQIEANKLFVLHNYLRPPATHVIR